MKRPETRCYDVRDQLPLFVGGDVDPEVDVSVRRHLEACPDCSARAEEASRAREVFLSTLREEEAGRPPADLWTGVRAALVREGRLQGVPGERRPSAPRPLTLVRSPVRSIGAGLAAAAALLVGVFLFDPSTDGSPGGSPGVVAQPTSAPAPVAATVTPLAPEGAPERAVPGMLRKLAPGEERLVDSATPVPHRHPARTQEAPARTILLPARSQPSLAGHRYR